MVLAKHTELDGQNVPEFRLSPGVLALRSHCPGELGTGYQRVVIFWAERVHSCREDSAELLFGLGVPPSRAHHPGDLVL
jgi:hypothetical protein